MIKLGSTYSDKITGLRGIATGVVLYITGCNQVLIQPPMDKEGKVPDSVWLDEQRLNEHSDVDRILLDNAATPGFDKAPPRR